MNDTFMKEKPVGPLLASMALPMVFSMLVNSLYNIVDSFFVAQISEDALNAVSLAFPLQNLMIAFGAMIGWGWVVSTGDWIGTAGVIGAMLGFILGGVMIFFIGMTYAELTPAMPECGGEHVFSMRAMGPIGSFVCTWAIVLGYVSVV